MAIYPMLSMLCRIHVRDSVNDHNIDNCNKLLEIVIGVKKIVEMLMIQKQDNSGTTEEGGTVDNMD